MRQREVTFHVCATSRRVGGWLEHLADLCCELQAIGAPEGWKNSTHSLANGRTRLDADVSHTYFLSELANANTVHRKT
jgi:hypothetical protein